MVSVLLLAVLGVAVGLLLGGLDLLGGLLSGGGTAERKIDGFNKAAGINFSWSLAATVRIARHDKEEFSGRELLL